LNWRGLVLFAVAPDGGAFLFREAITQTEEYQTSNFLICSKLENVSSDQKPWKSWWKRAATHSRFQGLQRKSLTTNDEVGSLPDSDLHAFQWHANGAGAFRCGHHTFRQAGIQRAGVGNCPASPYRPLPVILYFFFRSQIKMAGRSALNFGKSKAHALEGKKPNHL
jgi:cell division protease FtsH